MKHQAPVRSFRVGLGDFPAAGGSVITSPTQCFAAHGKWDWASKTCSKTWPASKADCTTIGGTWDDAAKTCTVPTPSGANQSDPHHIQVNQDPGAKPGGGIHVATSSDMAAAEAKKKAAAAAAVDASKTKTSAALNAALDKSIAADAGGGLSVGTALAALAIGGTAVALLYLAMNPPGHAKGRRAR